MQSTPSQAPQRNEGISYLNLGYSLHLLLSIQKHYTTNKAYAAYRHLSDVSNKDVNNYAYFGHNVCDFEFNCISILLY